jgi:nicotinate-nucleotide--dimethylbenzimidazole phosphoribosyltransferase
LTVIDVGVLTELPAHPQLVQAKVRSSSRNLARESAMSDTELAAAFACGRRAVADCAATVLLIGEMGIGNTTPATALACVLLEADPQDMTGPGTGLDAAGVSHKAAVIAKAMALHGYPVGGELKLAEAEDVLKLLSCLGGLEITAMVGAYLQAAAMRKVILIDGMIATAALACAVALEPAVLAFCVFSHTSSEPAHRHLLATLRASPLLDLQLRLGEGSGALCAYPLLVSACAIINGMASFEAAGVSGKAAD